MKRNLGCVDLQSLSLSEPSESNPNPSKKIPSQQYFDEFDYLDIDFIPTKKSPSDALGGKR